MNLSRPAVHERVRRLEAAGVIRGYTAALDWVQVGFPVTAYVNIRHKGTCAQVAPETAAPTGAGRPD